MRRIAADLELSLAPTQAAPARARAAVSAWLGDHGRDASLIEVALLLVSELVTNSIRHAVIGIEDSLRVTGRSGAAQVRLAVWDRGTDGRVGERPGDEAGGFGLQLVARLASAWGVERDADGTTVWLELAPTDRTS